MNNRFIALDLELEQPNDNWEVTDSQIQEEKIIQIGWVIFERDPFELLVSESRFVNIGIPLSSFIKKLTGIKDIDIANGESVDNIYKDLVRQREEYETSRIIRQWGGGDMYCLARELSPKIPWEFGFSGFNVKHFYQEYADMADLNRHCGLSKCVSRLGLEWMGQGKHRADIDALNTAQVYSELWCRMSQCHKNPLGWDNV